MIETQILFSCKLSPTDYSYPVSTIKRVMDELCMVKFHQYTFSSTIPICLVNYQHTTHARTHTQTHTHTRTPSWHQAYFLPWGGGGREGWLGGLILQEGLSITGDAIKNLVGYFCRCVLPAARPAEIFVWWIFHFS